MNSKIKNILSIVIGLFAGSLVNIGIIIISGKIVSPPESADLTTIEGLKSAMPNMKAIHFLMPFLAHAIGTFVGSFLAALLANKQKMRFAMVIGLFFLAGGIAYYIMLPSPFWFISLDATFAYIPMGYLAGKLAIKLFEKRV